VYPQAHPPGAPPKPPRRGPPLFVVIVLGGPLVFCCLPVTSFLVWAGFSSEALSNIGEDACAARGASGAPAYVPGPGVHRVAGFEQTATGWTTNYEIVPAEWKATEASDAELVLCVGDERRTVLERCPYEVSTGTSVIERVAYSRDARVLVARTGQLLGRKTVEGSAPSECSDAEAFIGAVGRNAVSQRASARHARHPCKLLHGVPVAHRHR
jgi:hypothetical protein